MHTPQDHVTECQYQVCSNKGCGLLIANPDLKDHERNKCIFRVVTCNYCQQKVVYNQLEVSRIPMAIVVKIRETRLSVFLYMSYAITSPDILFNC